MSLFRRRERSAGRGDPSSPRPTAPRREPAPPRPADWRSHDPIAAEYERVRAPITSAVARDLAGLVAEIAPRSILDVGTGTGVAAQAARETYPEAFVVGVDQAVEMLRVSRGARPDLPVAAAEAIDLPFREQRFDAVLLNFVLARFKRYETALFDLLRVLRSGGRIAASEWAAGAEDQMSRAWRALIEESVGKDLLKGTLREVVPWRDRFGDAGSFEGVLRDAGLSHVEVKRERYRFEIAREDYLDAQAIRPAGRFARQMLGDRGWASFRERAAARFAGEFPDPLIDFRDVLLVVARKS